MAALVSELASLFHLTQAGERVARGLGIREDGTVTSLSAVPDVEGGESVSEITTDGVSVKDTVTQKTPGVTENDDTDGHDRSDKDALKTSDAGKLEADEVGITESESRASHQTPNVGPETEGDVSGDKSAQKSSDVGLSETDVERSVTAHDISPDVLLDQELVQSVDTMLNVATSMSQDEELRSLLDSASLDMEDMEGETDCVSQLISDIVPLDGMEGLYSVSRAHWRTSDDGVRQTESRWLSEDNGFESTRVSTADLVMIIK